MTALTTTLTRPVLRITPHRSLHRGSDPATVAAPPKPERKAPQHGSVAVSGAPDGTRPAALPADCSRAAFLAQLGATREGLPQTRRLRRVEPQEALTAYAAALERDSFRLNRSRSIPLHVVA